MSIGEYIELVGEFEKINVYGNFWEFDFNNYLLTQNVKFKIFNPEIRILKHKNLRFYFYNSLNSSNNLTKLFLLQQKTGKEIYNDLLSIGLTYLINFSGFNIYLVSLFLNKVIFKNNKNYYKYKISLIILLLFYTWLLRFQPILFKTNILLFIKYFERIKNIKLNYKTRLTLTWSILLFSNPYYIFNIGFLYIILASIFLKINYEKKIVTNLIINFIWLNLIFIPIQMYFDYKIFWFGQIQEIILVPIISFLFLISFLFPFQFLNPFFNFLYIVLQNYIHFLTFFNLTTVCGHINILFILIYYLLLFLIKQKLFLKSKFKNWIYFLLSINFFCMSEINQFKLIDPSITMLNVGNGNSFILNYKRKTFIIDAGAGSGYSKNVLNDYLKYSGIRKIESIFISHNHLDHYNQLETIKKDYNIKNIFYNFDMLDTYKYKNLYIKNYFELNNKDENDNSQVLLITIKNKKLLFTGDISKKREQRLLSNKDFYNNVANQIDFLQVAHHGSKTSSSNNFISTLKPKTCFISSKKTSSRPFPDPNTLKVLKQNGCNTYITNGKYSYKYKINKNRVVNLNKKRVF